MVGSASNRAKLGETALPTGIAAQLAASAEATLQILTSEGACFGVTLSEVRKQAVDRFMAR